MIVGLDAQLAALDPEYTVHQVKEKFGGLRFYIGSDADPDRPRRRAWLLTSRSRLRLLCLAAVAVPIQPSRSARRGSWRVISTSH